MDIIAVMDIKSRDFLKKISPYKPGKPIEEVIRELNLKPPVIKLASNENPLGTSPLALKSMREALRSSYLYPDDNCYYLKQKLGGLLNVPPECILPGNGSVEILPLITTAFIEPGDSAIVSRGSFIWYKIAVNIANGELIEVPMKRHRHDLKSMLGAIKRNTRVIFIDNPINPTGTIVTGEEIDDFVRRVPENVLIVFDEAYHEYILNSNYPYSIGYLRNRDNILILRSFSKIYGLAGMRLGYAIASPSTIASLMKLRISFNVNRISQYGGIAALDDSVHVKRSVELNEEGKAYLSEAYEGLGLDYIPTFANFFFVTLNRDSQAVFEALQCRGIITRTIREYGFPNSLRITIGTMPQNRRLVSALKKVL